MYYTYIIIVFLVTAILGLCLYFIRKRQVEKFDVQQNYNFHSEQYLGGVENYFLLDATDSESYTLIKSDESDFLTVCKNKCDEHGNCKGFDIDKAQTQCYFKTDAINTLPSTQHSNFDQYRKTLSPPPPPPAPAPPPPAPPPPPPAPAPAPPAPPPSITYHPYNLDEPDSIIYPALTDSDDNYFNYCIFGKNHGWCSYSINPEHYRTFENACKDECVIPYIP